MLAKRITTGHDADSTAKSVADCHLIVKNWPDVHGWRTVDIALTTWR